MRIDRRVVLAALFAIASLLPLAPSPTSTAHAATVADSEAPRAASPERWWGAVGAMVCGAGIKLVTMVGPQPSVLAVAISGCALAALDVITTQE